MQNLISNAQVQSATSAFESTGANISNTIKVGDGNNVIFGGEGADTINTGNGANVVFGDGGSVTFDLAGTHLATAKSTDITRGGNDTITVGNGNSVLVGGFGADTINAGTGSNVILGDNGMADFSPLGVVTLAASTDLVPATGGNDTIKSKDGNDVIIGGVGQDSITIGNTVAGGLGASVVLGDNGTAQFNATGTQLVSVSTDLAVQGGNDTIQVGAGNMVVFGGYGADSIAAAGVTTPGVGINGILVGDNGTATYDAVTGHLKQVKTTDTTSTTGGDDTITAGNGNIIAIGGVGKDTISLGNTVGGTSIVMGDNGEVDFDATGTQLTSVSTDLTVAGDNDTVNVGTGNMVAFGGYGADSITAAGVTTTGTAINSILVGDNGSAAFTAGVVTEVTTTDTTSATGGNDTINAGNGNTIAMGGVGKDTISLGNTVGGTSIVMGDNGTVLFNSTGSQLTSVFTDLTVAGDNDNIKVGTGNMVVFGGYGADSITAGSGINSIFVGDNGTATFTAGVVTEVMTTDTTSATGGDDTITAGVGNDIAIGGVGADTISLGNTAGNTSIVLGDNGDVQFNSAGTLLKYVSTDLNLGGDDTINVGTGNFVVFGGYGADSITAVAGSNSILVGDNGSATFNTGGRVTQVTTPDPDISTGGNDTITAGNGNDIAIGGVGQDSISLGDTVSGGTSIVLGDNGTVRLQHGGAAAPS